MLLLLFLENCSLDRDDDTTPIQVNQTCYSGEILLNAYDGCNDFGYADYPDIDSSIYVLPFAPGLAYPTGLTNCSSSFHAKGMGDEYAFDFNMPDNTEFTAIRSGTVVEIEQDRPNYANGTVGNYIHIQHSDNTLALYYHSPPDGFLVELGDPVAQGQVIGLSGTSGYAGYPHLHLIVVEEDTSFPFKGVPIAFKNVHPRHTVLKTNFVTHKACEY